MKSLFNEDIPDIPPQDADKEIRGKFKKWKWENLYHRSQMGDICCKNCNNFVRTGAGNKTFFKCKVMGDSRSTASDIRANFVCKNFERP